MANLIVAVKAVQRRELSGKDGDSDMTPAETK